MTETIEEIVEKFVEAEEALFDDDRVETKMKEMKNQHAASDGSMVGHF